MLLFWYYLLPIFGNGQYCIAFDKGLHTNVYFLPTNRPIQNWAGTKS